MASICDVKRHGLKTSTAGTSLWKPVEVEVIQLFARLSSAPGQLRSVGAIHGRPFVAHLSLPLNGLKDRSDFSNGSTSQGFKFFRELGDGAVT
jgi:DNA-binding transcriptional regulator GbsR (MarR family)